MLDDQGKSAEAKPPIVVKKYANRRLYNTETSTYVTLEDLAQMVRSDRDFVVFDAKSGTDLTHSVLTQIIVEQEARGTGPNLLPTPFLRQLIRFYDDMGVSKMVPSYLQMSLESLAREQERLRAQFTNPWGAATLDAYNEQIRKNMAVFENAMSMWSPTSGTEDATAPDDAQASGSAGMPSTASDAAASKGEAKDQSNRQTKAAKSEPQDLSELRGQLADMQRKIEELARSK